MPHGWERANQVRREQPTPDAAALILPNEQARKDAEWAGRMADADRQWQTCRGREAAVLLLNKAAPFEALAAVGIASVAVTFDGSGDSGQIEDVTASDSAGRTMALPSTTVAFHDVGFDAAEPTTTTLPVEGALERLAYGLLEQTHGGWENNDGTYGEFTVDVTERRITLDHNERFIETICHEYEF